MGRRAPPRFADANAPLSGESSWSRRSSSRTRHTRSEFLRRRSLGVDGNPPAHPRKLRPGRGRRAPHRFADANAPLSCRPSWLRRSSSRAHRTHPELLRRRSRRGRRTRPSSQPRCGRQAPPADRLRKLRRTAPTRASSSFIVDGELPPSSLTQTPPLLRALVVAPEQLSLPSHPPRAPPSSQPPCGRQPPPADRLRRLRRTAPTRTSSGLVVDGELPPGSLTQTPPSPASLRGCAGPALAPAASAPSSSVVGAADEPAASSSVTAATVRTASSPRRSAPRKLLAELLPPAQAPASSRTATFKQQGRVGRAEDCGRERPPFLRRAHPIPGRPPSFHFPRPRAPQRAVAFRTFPPPSGPGADRPWLRRGRRKRRPGIPVIAHYPNPVPARHSPPPGCALT